MTSSNPDSKDVKEESVEPTASTTKEPNRPHDLSQQSPPPTGMRPVLIDTKEARSNEDKSKSEGARPQVRLDDSKALACYANFCRVTGTPEELIIDFGLNPQPFGVPTEPIAINHRLIVNFYTAKRLFAALQVTLQRHEAAFGALETDVQKRVLPAAMRQSSVRAGEAPRELSLG